MNIIGRLYSFLTGGQSDFFIPLSHQWHGVNVAPALYAVAAIGCLGLLYYGAIGLWRAARRQPAALPFLVAMLYATAAYAASSTLGNLSAGTTITDTDLFYDVQTVGTGGVKVTGLQLRTYIALHVGTVTSIATGCQATGGTITTTGTISTQFLESANSPSSSGGYTLASTDACTNLVLKSGYSGTVTVPATSTSGFGNGAYFTITNESGVNVLVNVTTDTLGTYSAFNLGAGQISFNSDGTNYHFIGGQGTVSFQTGSSTGNTLTATNGYFNCTGTCTVTPPAPVPGYQFCVMNDDNVSTVITLGAISGVQYENTARTSYKSANTAIASGGAAGDMLCIVGRDATHYLSPTYVGTWS